MHSKIKNLLRDITFGEDSDHPVKNSTERRKPVRKNGSR